MGYASGTNRNQLMMTSLDEMVDPESMVRIIDKYIEITNFSQLGFDKCQPADTGRPAYQPKSLAKLYVYGYENGVRSSRKLERETHINIEVKWLLGSLTPDHKTIAEFRRKNVRALQKLFRDFVQKCKSWELIDGELIAVDGTKIKASNNKKNNYSRKKLEARLAHIDEQIKAYLTDIEEADNTEKYDKLVARKEKYEEYVETLDQVGENEISEIDPDARLMGNNRGGVDIAYNIQSAVDGKHDMIIEYDVSLNPSDQHQLGNMVKKVKRKMKVKKFTVLADKGYYNGADLLRVKKNKVTAIVSRQNPSDSKNLPEEYRSDKFIYNATANTFTCPMGKVLTTGNKKEAERKNYRNKLACKECPNREKCITGKADFRTVTRNQYGKIYDETDKRFRENQELYKRRQEMVEHPFGTVKHTMNGGYFLLRTRRKTCGEIALLFLGYNLKRALKVLGFGGLMERLESLFLQSFDILWTKWHNASLCPQIFNY